MGFTIFFWGTQDSLFIIIAPRAGPKNGDMSAPSPHSREGHKIQSSKIFIIGNSFFGSIFSTLGGEVSTPATTPAPITATRRALFNFGSSTPNPINLQNLQRVFGSSTPNPTNLQQRVFAYTPTGTKKLTLHQRNAYSSYVQVWPFKFLIYILHIGQ